MNWKIISALVAGLFSLSLGFFVFSKKKEGMLNRTFLLLSISVGLWNFADLLIVLSSNNEMALFWDRVAYIGAFFILPFALKLDLLVINYYDRKYYKIFFNVVFIYALILSVISFTPLFIVRVTIVPFKEESGPLYFLFLVYFLLIATSILFFLFKAYLKTKSIIKKNQLKYIFFSLAMGAISIGFYILTLFFTKIPPIHYFLEILYLLIFAYAIIRYRLIDISFVYRRGIIFFIYVINNLIILIVLSHFLQISIIGMIIVFLLVVLSPLEFKYLSITIQKAVDKIVFRGKFDYLEKLKETAESHPPLYTSGDIAERFTEVVCTMMKVDNCSFMIYNSWRDQFRPKAHMGLDDILGDEYIMPGIVWDTEEPLIKHIEKNKKIIIKEEMELKSKKKNKEIINTMSSIRAEVILPIFVRLKLVAIIGIGNKQSKRVFGPNDLKLFDSLMQVIEKDLSHTHFMEERTVFSAKVAHDLRSPFGWLVNGIANIRSGIYGKTTKEQKERLTDILKGVQGLERNIRHFFNLNVLLQKVSHNQYDIVKDDISHLIERVQKRFRLTAEKEGIQIVTKIPDDLPSVLMNSEDIEEHVFANLIINALKYTKKGKLTLSAEVKDKNVICCVEDTGKGIPKASLPKVFNPYFHTEDEEKQKGVGLGLVIVKEVVEANGGSVWVESQAGKGTKFYFTLAVA